MWDVTRVCMFLDVLEWVYTVYLWLVYYMILARLTLTLIFFSFHLFAIVMSTVSQGKPCESTRAAWYSLLSFLFRRNPNKADRGSSSGQTQSLCAL